MRFADEGAKVVVVDILEQAERSGEFRYAQEGMELIYLRRYLEALQHFKKAIDGYPEEAESIMRLTRERMGGDQLQTSAIFDDQFRVLSKITDPNDYAGPGTGYVPGDVRRAEIDAIRQQRSTAELTADQAEHQNHILVSDVEPARQGAWGLWKV